MKTLKSIVALGQRCSRSLAWVAASVLLCGLADATVIYNNSITVQATDPTQLGRLSRNGIQQDWSGGEPFPGVINSTLSYHYHALDLDLDALEAGYTAFGGFIQIEFDSLSQNTFLSAYLGAYLPDSAGAPNFGFDTNWLGDAGVSGDFFGTDPIFFQVVVPSVGTHHLILVLNDTTTNGGGLNFSPTNLVVEAFTDTEFTDLNPRSGVPEPGTWALLVCGIALLALRRYRSAPALRSACFRR